MTGAGMAAITLEPSDVAGQPVAERGGGNSEPGIFKSPEIENAVAAKWSLVRLLGEKGAGGYIVDHDFGAKDFPDQNIIAARFDHIRIGDIVDPARGSGIFRDRQDRVGKVGSKDGLLKVAAAADQAQGLSLFEAIQEGRIAAVERQAAQLSTRTVDMSGPEARESGWWLVSIGESQGSGVP